MQGCCDKKRAKIRMGSTILLSQRRNISKPKTTTGGGVVMGRRRTVCWLGGLDDRMSGKVGCTREEKQWSLTAYFWGKGKKVFEGGKEQEGKIGRYGL